MSQCKNHPEREAIAVCSACGSPLCEECIAPGTEESPVCLDCSISQTQRELAQAAPGPAVREATPRKGRQISPAMRVVIGIGLVVILAELGVIFLMSPARFHARQTVAPGSKMAEQIATAQTAADLIVVREVLESYHREHQRYPADLETVRSDLPRELAATIDDGAITYAPDNNGHYKLSSQGDGPKSMRIDSSAVVITMEDTP